MEEFWKMKMHISTISLAPYLGILLELPLLNSSRFLIGSKIYLREENALWQKIF